MISREFRITGRVQGVFYRAGAKEKAEEFGISGWVANNADGSVTVHAEGPDQLLKDFEEWCRVGPSSAHVEALIVNEAPMEHAESFEIVY